MRLVTLAPEYRPKEHQVYLDLLERAVRDPDTRSVALTGSYGSGKSSVLRALDQGFWNHKFPWWHRRRVIELSMSTLDPHAAPVVQVENPAERAISNRIQKELVKQLLYRLPPAKTPHSRFPRASGLKPLTGVSIALACAALVGLAWVVAAFAGWQSTIAQRVEGIGWSEPWFWVGATAALVLVALAAWRTLAGRYAIRAGLKTGALTVSLEPTSSSYFDQYLDEIMYFFQVSKADVVLIEDVDRFSDAVVFDTLRALNTLVNGSRQVGRRVVFVYAIRDSVLGRIGERKREDDGQRDDDGHRSDDSQRSMVSSNAGPAREMDRANRAKFFDVIIPIVPFVTTDNARDLMLQVMEPHVKGVHAGGRLSPALIRLASRHVADMRTLLSIRNEFEVHLDRLVTSADKKMPEISEDIILSLVLLRATSPDAYESIRLATSPLDVLTQRWLKLVDHNLETQTRRLTALRTQLEDGGSLEARARRAGIRLDSLRPELFSLATTFVADHVAFTGPVADADLTDVSGWQRIADGEALTMTLRSEPNSYGQRTKAVAKVGPQVLARLIGMPIDPKIWRDADLDELRGKIDATEKEIVFLRHHRWDEIYARTDLVVEVEPGDVAAAGGTASAAERRAASSESGSINFKGLVQGYAPTPLARDLLANGYLPRHFARYASMFYGNDVGLSATDYIARAIEPGVPIPEYELDEDAVSQILREQNATKDDADLFDDTSIYNLDILRYLLKHRPGAAKRVAEHLATRWEAQEQKLAERFFQREDGEIAGNLASLMAPTWKQALHYTAVSAEVTPGTRVHLVNAALAAITAGEREDVNPELGKYLSEHYAEMPVVTHPVDDARATIVMTAIAAAGGVINDLGELGSTARIAATQVSVYPMTEPNLSALGGADTVALDVLGTQSRTRPIYDHALANLASYLDALAQLEPPGVPLADPTKFATVLNDIAGTPQGYLLDRFVGATPAGCRIADLSETVPETWPTLIAHRRTDPTFGNVHAYDSEHGLDETLGDFLAEHSAITTPPDVPQPERLALATKILAARQEIGDAATRVPLAESVAPGVIPIGQIAPEDANLIGPLLVARLLTDEPATFDPRLLKQWKDFEPAVAASGLFGEFADAAIMPPRMLAQTLQSSAVRRENHSGLIAKLPSLLSGATAADATAVALALAARQEPLDRERLETLRLAGASRPSLVRLLASQGAHLALDDLRAVLLLMGDDYARVSRGSGSGGTVRFDVDQDHRTVLERLDGVTHTGAKEKHTKKHGTKLEASLKQPAT